MSGFVVDIPVPPSLNNAYVNRVLRTGKVIRVLAPDARHYKEMTAREINVLIRPARRIDGAYDVLLELPAKMRGDTDNRIKLALDALVMSGRVPDDAHARQTTARKCLPGNLARLTVTPAP